MALKNTLIYLSLFTMLLSPVASKADDSAKNVDRKKTVASAISKKSKEVEVDTQAYPSPNEPYRNDGKDNSVMKEPYRNDGTAPSCVSSPEQSGAGNRSFGFPN